MSLSTTFDAITPQARTETRTLTLIVWSATVVSYLVAGAGDGARLSTDDAMRLVEVRDFLAGQNWFDLTQYRLSPPSGVVTHWSRLIDLPLAAIIVAAEWIVSPSSAETLATFVWPAGLLLAFVVGVSRLARELAGEAAARLALLFAALMGPVLQHFRPGAIDHHNAQLVLLVWTLVFAVRACQSAGLPGSRHREREAALAGGLCALSLAIGLEMAPAIVALAGAMALRWTLQGEVARATTGAFAGAFAVATLTAFAATVPRARYGLAACDTLSIVHVVAAGAGGLGLLGLTRMRRLSSASLRLAALAVFGVLLGILLLMAFPACLADPYGDFDPRLAELWLANVSEARSVFTLLRDLPQEVPAHYGLPCAGLALALWRARRDAGVRWGWIIGACVLMALCAVALWEVRGAAAANTVAIALVTAALVRAFPAPERPLFLGLGRSTLVVAALLNPLALIAAGMVAARAAEIVRGSSPPQVIADGPGTCRRASDYAQLARLPRGLVLAFIDAGPSLLMETPHSVLAAPYHRNVRGNAAMLDVFLAPPAEAAARMAELGVDYVAFCPASPERYNYARAAPDGLAARLSRGEVPNYLTRVDLDGTDLAVYRAPL